jgi:hypothetical protein
VKGRNVSVHHVTYRLEDIEKMDLWPGDTVHVVGQFECDDVHLVVDAEGKARVQETPAYAQ